MTYWKEVRSKAAATTFRSLSWDTTQKIVVWIVVQIVAGALIAYSLHLGVTDPSLIARLLAFATPFAIWPAVFCWNFIHSPALLAAENSARAAAEREKMSSAEKQLRSRVAELENENKILRAPTPPPARDPDGIYQHSRKVAVVVAPYVLPSGAGIRFQQILSGSDFAANKTFEYRDYTLQITGIAASTTAVVSGRENRQFVDVQSEILGRL